jgi:inosose dehydratase
MAPIRLATGPVTWGVDFAGMPGNPPWSHVLDEIRRSGIGALELGPVGYLPEDPARLREALDSRGLSAVGGFVFEDLHEPARAGAALAVAARACRAAAAARGRVLVIIDRPGRERAATARRRAAARRPDPRRWDAMVRLIARIAAIARDAGLDPVLHPHAGSFVEFHDEIERVLEATDVGLCLDTGHCAYARIDPAEAVATYAARLGHVHLKDVDGSVLARADRHALGFWDAVEQGVFCPLGEGIVDLRAVLAALRAIGYEGFATLEQDRVTGSGAPLDDLRKSLAVVRAEAAGDRPRATRET